MPDPAPRPRRRWLRRLLIAFGLLLVVPALLFVLNGLVFAYQTRPRMLEVGVTPQPRRAEGEVTVVAYNIAKAFVHRSGFTFDTRERVEERLRKMAANIRAENPDIVFLAEAITSCGPCNIDQVEFIARECGLPHVVTGENYNVGVPFYKIAGGNAVLSRFPLTPIENFDLVGRQAFWVTKNNRRALAVSAEFAGKPVLLVALHNDSFDMRNNSAQMKQILEWIGDRPAMLAGDFNNRPEERSIKMVKETGKFAGEWAGAPTFFEGDRKERIDFIFAPVAWTHLESKVIADDTSDHRPLVSRFKLPG